MSLTTYQQANKLFEANKIPAASKLFEKSINEDPTNKDAKFKLGICRFRQKNFDGAEKIFRIITSTNYNDFRSWYYLGLCAERKGLPDDASSAYKIALAINPNFKEAKKKLNRDSEPIETPKGKVTNIPVTETAGDVVFTTNRRVSSFTRHFFIIAIVFVGWSFFLVATGEIRRLFRNGSITEFTFFLLMIILAIFIDSIIRAKFTKYIIYEKRIDIKSGIFFRKHIACWLYEITNVSFSRNPIHLITGNASITIETERDAKRGKGQKEEYKLVGMKSLKSGIRSLKFMESFFDNIRNSIREERGRIKKMWV